MHSACIMLTKEMKTGGCPEDLKFGTRKTKEGIKEALGKQFTFVSFINSYF